MRISNAAVDARDEQEGSVGATQVSEQSSPAAAEPSPRDRFDRLPAGARIGVHRVVGRPRRFWVYLVSALLGIALLTGAGIVWVMVTGANVNSVMNNWNQTPPSSEPKAPTVRPQLDPTAEVVVLNGTAMRGFAAIVDGIITENKWGVILFSGEAASGEVQISAVFYEDPADEAAALGLAKELGGVSVFENDSYAEYGARLVVLLGADYGGPGSESLVRASTPAATPRS